MADLNSDVILYVSNGNMTSPEAHFDSLFVQVTDGYHVINKVININILPKVGFQCHVFVYVDSITLFQQKAVFLIQWIWLGLFTYRLAITLGRTILLIDLESVRLAVSRSGFNSLVE